MNDYRRKELRKLAAMWPHMKNQYLSGREVTSHHLGNIEIFWKSDLSDDYDSGSRAVGVVDAEDFEGNVHRLAIRQGEQYDRDFGPLFAVPVK